jgi:DNA polymerase III delta prime subunit
MNPIVTKILETNIKGQLNGADIGGGICIAGAPGIGKTQTMYKIAKDLNMHIMQVSIHEISTENLSGIPDFMDATHMDAYSVTNTKDSQATKWSVPQIIETVNRLASDKDKDGCILFIDDLHRVNMAVAPYLYGLLGERKLGSYRLDQRVAIMGAMNDSDEAGFSGIDSPIKDRLGILPVPFDFEYWFENFGKKLHFYISSFLKAHSSYIQEDESTMIEQFATPRSWTHLANEFELYDLNFIKENTTFLAKQKVSISAANELSKPTVGIRF